MMRSSVSVVSGFTCGATGALAQGSKLVNVVPHELCTALLLVHVTCGIAAVLPVAEHECEQGAVQMEGQTLTQELLQLGIQ